MKQIKAYVHVNRIADVVAALEAAGNLSNAAWVRNLNFTRVEGLLRPTHDAETRYSVPLGKAVIEEVCLELLCEDLQVDMLVKLIERTARTGQELAGWIVATPIDLAVPIRGRHE